ncbi:MAG: adenosylcobinamide-GDP ribazoletransferase [Gammaproteobacteria bacterium]|nr:adenosylcobinamide-GDP ribazoletransferase [Gammaproteobacteria bacterium]
MNPFWIALQFLTTLPTPKINNYGDQQMGRSVLFYPLVGLLIGLILWASAHLIIQANAGMAYGDLLSAALVLTVWVALTGALHIDGLADCADAWMGGLGDKGKTFAILKDPTSGPIAVTVICLALLLKWLCLGVLLASSHAIYLVWVPLLSRGGILVFFLSLPYVRDQGIAATMARMLPRKTAIGLCGLLGASLLLLNTLGIVLLIALSLLFLFFRRHLLKRLGGFTGDTLGAWVECSELLLLLCIVLMVV